MTTWNKEEAIEQIKHGGRFGHKRVMETNALLAKNFTPLPLTDSAKIFEGNALHIDWGKLGHFDYIMGNPPFVGASMMTVEQKAEAVAIFGKGKRVNSIDYVGAWYYRACEYCSHGDAETRRADEPCRGGERVEVGSVVASGRATSMRSPHERRIFNADGTCIIAKNISPYLIDAPTTFVESRGHPICDVPPMTYGNKPSDGGNLILSQEERDVLLKGAGFSLAYNFTRELMAATNHG